MSALVQTRLIIIALAGTAASVAGTDDLRGPEAFSSIANRRGQLLPVFVSTIFRSFVGGSLIGSQAAVSTGSGLNSVSIAR